MTEYFSVQPARKRALLQEMRKAIKKDAPGAEEAISYNMPAFKHQEWLLAYAAFKEHIGFFPGASAIVAFKKDMSAYKWSKGAIRFPIDKPLPLGLVSRIAKYRLKENAERVAVKKIKAGAK